MDRALRVLPGPRLLGRTAGRIGLLALPALFLAAFFALPLATLLQHAGSADAWEWLGSAFVRQRVAGAAAQAALTTVLAMALAVPLAWLHHRRTLPRWTLELHAAPFVLPVFVVVYGLQATVGASGWLQQATGLDLLAALGPFGAIVLAHVYYNYGMAARLLHALLERRPRRLEEAARTLGAPPGAAFARTTLRLLLPSAAAVAALVWLFAFASFGVVLALGQGQLDTLETLLYGNLSGAFPRLDRSATLALLQLALNATLLGLTMRLSRRAWGDDATARRAKAGPWRLAAIALALLPMLPAAAVLVQAFQVAGHWSLEPWRALLDAGHPAHLAGFSLARAVGNSLLYALGAAGLAALLALAVAFGARRRWVELVAALPLGTSSLVLGLGLATAYGAGAGLLDLRGNPLLVVAAHTLVAFPLAVRLLVPAVAGLEPRLAESAATLGAGPLQRLLRVHLPLLRPTLAATAGLAAALSLGDLGASLLLMTPDTMGLTVWIARTGASFDPLRRAEATALAAVLLALTTLVAGLVALARPRRAA